MKFVVTCFATLFASAVANDAKYERQISEGVNIAVTLTPDFLRLSVDTLIVRKFNHISIWIF